MDTLLATITSRDLEDFYLTLYLTQAQTLQPNAFAASSP